MDTLYYDGVAVNAKWDKYIHERSPHLSEDGNRPIVSVESGDENTVYLYTLFPRYKPHAVREFQAKSTNEYVRDVLSKQEYEWAGAGAYLTPKRARKLAKALKQFARQVESRD